MNHSFFGILALTAITVSSIAFSPISATALGIGAPSSLGVGMHGENSANGGENRVGARVGGDVTTNVRPDITGTNAPIAPIDKPVVRAATDAAATTSAVGISDDTSATITQDVNQARKKERRRAARARVNATGPAGADVNSVSTETPAQLGVSVPVKANVGVGVESRTLDTTGR